MTPNGNFPKFWYYFGGPPGKDYSILGSKIRYPPCLSSFPLDSWGGCNGKENGNYYNGLCRDYYKDPFLHS